MGFIIFVVLFAVSILFLIITEKYGKKKYGDNGWKEQKKLANEEMSRDKGAGIKCPNCGHLGVNKISTLKKSASASIWGLASDKIGKTYECPHCKFLW